VLGVGTTVGVLLVWQALASAGAIHFSYLPAPFGIIKGIGSIASSGELWPSLYHTVWIALAAWAASAVIGVVLGFVIASSPVIYRYTMASVELLRALPAITFVPIAVLAFGFSAKTEIVIAIYVAQWPVLINTIGGVRGVAPRLLDVGRTLRLGPVERMAKLTLPAALPTILVGLRLSLSLSLVLVIVAEMVGNPTGIGYQIVFQEQALQPEKMYAYVIIVGLLGVLLNAVFDICAKRFPAGTANPKAAA